MSATEMALPGPEVEVVAKASRRRFTVEYKRKMVREADGCKTAGAVGALLRREGLARRRGPAPRPADPRDKRITELERETVRWRTRAERAEALVELQKKLSALLGTPLEGEGS